MEPRVSAESTKVTFLLCTWCGLPCLEALAAPSFAQKLGLGPVTKKKDFTNLLFRATLFRRRSADEKSSQKTRAAEKSSQAMDKLYLKLYLNLLDLKLQLRAQLRASASPGPGAGALRDIRISCEVVELELFAPLHFNFLESIKISRKMTFKNTKI